MERPRVTLRTVAAAAGVSLNTVSLALRDSPRLSPATRLRVRKLARKMGYAPNPVLAAGMAQLRGRRETPEFGGVLAVLHFETPEMVRRWSATRETFRGIMERAGALGYKIEVVPLQPDPAADGAVWRRLEAMGVPGVIVFGLVDAGGEERLAGIVERLPAVGCAFRMKRLRLHAVEAGHFAGTQLAVRRVRELGYGRVGLVVNAGFDAACECAFTGGFYAAAGPDGIGCPPLRIDAGFRNAGVARGRIAAWWEAHRPDVILTTLKWFTAEEWRDFLPAGAAPALAQLGVAGETPNWAGIAYANDAMGAATVDALVAQIHRGERGVPAVQRVTWMEGSWMDGGTCPARRKMIRGQMTKRQALCHANENTRGPASRALGGILCRFG